MMATRFLGRAIRQEGRTRELIGLGTCEPCSFHQLHLSWVMIDRVADTLTLARVAQPLWGATSVADRLRVITALRRLIGQRAAWLAEKIKHRSLADTLVAEVLPLAEAARFLCQATPALLKRRRPPGSAPLWLAGVGSHIHRVPLGVVLVIGPGNYPLLLPGVQALQALAAGNVVAIKPAPGCSEPMRALAGMLKQAGLPEGTLWILDEADGPKAAAAGFDHVVFTGSAETGRKVLEAAASTLTPCTMELSGCDAAFVLPGADLDVVAKSLAYGLRLNGGATCIAPRRVFICRGDANVLEAALLPRLKEIAPTPLASTVLQNALLLLSTAESAGARVIGKPSDPCGPLVVLDAKPEMALLKTDLFTPWLAVVPVDDVRAMILADAVCPFALGASIWGPARLASAVAIEIRALSICINDVIVPTADPRLPFGGRGRSGYGSTRGAEGLLAMTAPKVISRRWLPFRPHLATSPPLKDAARFGAMIRILHAGWRQKFSCPSQ
jgi:acyl-CoA reductase-like NAD-dependent aldehyde dehydrogenase